VRRQDQRRRIVHRRFQSLLAHGDRGVHAGAACLEQLFLLLAVEAHSVVIVAGCVPVALVIDPGEDQDVEQQQEHPHRDRHREGRRVALIVTGRELTQKIVRPRTQIRVLQRAQRGGRHGGGDGRVRGALRGRQHGQDRGGLRGGWHGQWRCRYGHGRALRPHRALVQAGTLGQVVMPHVDLVARPVQLRQQVQPEGHLVAPVVRTHLRTVAGLQIQLIYGVVRVPERRTVHQAALQSRRRGIRAVWIPATSSVHRESCHS